MPIDLISVSAIVCDKILTEKDDAVSAIRIVDVFLIPESIHKSSGEHPAYGVQFYILLVIKAKDVGKMRVVLRLQSPSGEERPLRSSLPEEVTLTSKFPNSGIPVGHTLTLQVNLEAKPLGTYYVRVEIDGKERIRVPFTLRLDPSQS